MSCSPLLNIWGFTLKFFWSRMPGFWYMCYVFTFCKHPMLILTGYLAHNFYYFLPWMKWPEYSWCSVFSHLQKGKKKCRKTVFTFWNEVLRIVKTVLIIAQGSGSFSSINAVSRSDSVSYDELLCGLKRDLHH